MTSTQQPATIGVHHVGLTVRDVVAARDFFLEALGYREVGGRPDYPSIFVSDGRTMITLWQLQNPAEAREFDRKSCIGLHHLALRVETLEGLGALYTSLAARSDTQIEFAPEPLGTSGARHMMLLGPSGLRLELVWLPS